jgi:hypothetical protein
VGTLLESDTGRIEAEDGEIVSSAFRPEMVGSTVLASLLVGMYKEGGKYGLGSPEPRDEPRNAYGLVGDSEMSTGSSSW